MKTERVTTHELNEGDHVLHYGVVFELHTRKAWAKRDGDSEAQGECITFETTVIDATNRSVNFPKSWLADWVFQGNGLAHWARIISEGEAS